MSFCQDHTDCQGDATACEAVFKESERKHSAMLKQKPSLKSLQSFVSSVNQGEGQHETASGPSSSSMMMEDVEPVRLDFDLFEDPDAEPQPPKPMPGMFAQNQKGFEHPRARLSRSEALPENVKGRERFQQWSVASAPATPLPEELEVRTPGSSSGAPGEAEPEIPKKHNDLLEKAQGALNKYEESLSDYNLWANKVKKRPVQTAVKSLRSYMDQLSSVNHPRATELTDRITDFSEGLEPKFEMFADLRGQPLKFAGDMPEEMLEMISKFPYSLVSSLILFVAQECLKELDKDDSDSNNPEASATFFTVCGLKPGCLNCGLGYSVAADSCESVARTSLQSFSSNC